MKKNLSLFLDGCGWTGVNATPVAMYIAMQIEVCRVNHWTPNYTISII